MTVKGSLHNRITKVIEAYNGTWHLSIGMTPNQARNPENQEQVRRNQFDKRIKENAKNLMLDTRQKFQVDDLVLVKAEVRRTKNEPLFKELALVKEVLEFDTYLVANQKGRSFKRHASQLKPCGGKRGDVELSNKYLRLLNK